MALKSTTSTTTYFIVNTPFHTYINHTSPPLNTCIICITCPPNNTNFDNIFTHYWQRLLSENICITRITTSKTLHHLHHQTSRHLPLPPFCSSPPPNFKFHLHPAASPHPHPLILTSFADQQPSLRLAFVK